MNHIAIPAVLSEYLCKLSKPALAFSGGVDSAYVLYAAKTCGLDVRPYYVKTQFQPQFEYEDARRLAGELNIPLTVIELDILAIPAVAANPPDRCYHCKQAILEQIATRASQDGYTTLLDGSNASDDAGDRPGMRALAERGVLSPLRDCGIAKQQVRELSKQAGLFTWDKPAYACLATRIPTGKPIDADTLHKVELAETALHTMGYRDFRVRILGSAAKLQFPAEDIQAAARWREKILEALSPLFDDVYLDLKPR